MGGNDHDNLTFVTRLLRRQQAQERSPLQFSLQALLLTMAYGGVFIWLTQFLVDNTSLGMPLFMRIGFVLLWAAVIAGATLSRDAWPYFMGGLIGLAFSSPVLLIVYVNDLEAIPLVTGWSTSLAFAVFANLGGAISNVVNGRLWFGALGFAAIVPSIVMLAIFFAG